MRSNYRRVGDLIKQIKVKNTDGRCVDLLGININKYFMPSVANVVGTDLTKYKVVKYNQFACNRMHVGRDYRIPIALSDKAEPFIVSPAYTVFEILDDSLLLPDYLMMWFSRPEFDREAWFHTDADVRGGLPWDLFCDIELPLPNIEKQREIVAEYNTVVNRIKLNEALNQKLEETAQTLYKHWFVDFEFPNEDGLPYKSSGGNMVWCDELDTEIPKGWWVKEIKNFTSKMTSGATPNRSFEKYWLSKDFPWLKTGELKNQVIIDSEEYISSLALKESSAKIIPVNAVLVAMYGQGDTKGQVGYLKKKSSTNQACCAMICENETKSSYLYYYFRVNRDEIVSHAIGGAQPNLSKQLIEKLMIIEPPTAIMQEHPFIQILKKRENLTRQNSTLAKLKNLLLSKMTKVEELKTEIV